jgi:hypothetical protein
VTDVNVFSLQIRIVAVKMNEVVSEKDFDPA